jgi:hypothetical protein
MPKDSVDEQLDPDPAHSHAAHIFIGIFIGVFALVLAAMIAMPFLR